MNLRKFALLGLIVAGFFALAACDQLTTTVPTTEPTTVTTTVTTNVTTTTGTTTVPTTVTTTTGVTTTTMSDLAKVQEVIDALTLGDISGVTEDLTLPAPATYGVVVTWATSDDALITTFGEVTVPSYEDGNQTVTLTATVTLGDTMLTKDFLVTITAETAEEFLAGAATAIIITSADAITANFLLPSLVRGATVTWTSGNTAVATIAGTVDGAGFYAVTIVRPKAENGGENTTVILTATLTIGTTSITSTKSIRVIAEPPATVFTSFATLHGASGLNDYVDVTGIAYAKFNGGYFLLDTEGDYLAVYTTAANYNAVAIGDQVRIKGLYKNYYTLFQISNLTYQEVISHDNVFTITPTVLVDALDLKAIDAAADRVMHGTVYTITVTVKVLTSGYVDIYVGAERVGTVYSYSLTDSLNALKAQANKVVTIDVIFYTLHPSNGVMVVFQGSAADIELAVLTGQDAVDADAAALSVPTTAVGGQPFTLAKLGAYGSAVAWSITNGAAYATLNPANDKITFGNVTEVQTVELTATLTLAGVIDPTTRVFTITVNPITTSTIAQVRAMTVSAQLVQIEGIVYFFTNNSYYITDATGNLNIYTVAPAGMALGDRVVIVGTLAAYNGQIQITNAVVKSTVSIENPYVQTPEVYVPGVSALVSGKTYTVTGTVAIRGTNNNVYIMDGETILMAIYYRSTINDSFNALKAQVGKQITFNGVYLYNGNDSNLSPAVPGQIFFVYQEGAAGLILPELTDAEKLASDKTGLTISLEALSNGTATLPALGGYESAITWEVVSGGAVIAAGVVTYPQVLAATINVVLRATLTKGVSSDTKEFTVVVSAIVPITISEAFAKIAALGTAQQSINGTIEVVQGTILGFKWKSGFAVYEGIYVTDGTHVIFVYTSSTATTAFAVGDVVLIKGQIMTYYYLPEISNVTVLQKVDGATPETFETVALTIEQIHSYTNITTPYYSNKITVVGTLIVGGNDSATWIIDGAGRKLVFSRVVADLTTLAALNGKVVTFTGFLNDYNNSMSAWRITGAGSTFVEYVPPTLDITVTPENFNTNKDELYWGATTGWALSGTDVASVASVTVSLYDALGNLLVTNTSKEASKVNTAKQYSSAFIVKAGTYATSSTWTFGSWIPTALVSPAKAVITVTDVNGLEYTAELNTFAAEEPSHPTWASLFEVADIVVTPENFNTNKGDDYWGATTGWALSGADVGKVVLVTVELYDAANNLLVTNVSKSPSKVNTAKQYSSAFIVLAGTYATSSTWEFGVWTPSKDVMPAKAVITVTDYNGFEYVAELTAFLQEEPSHPTWASLFPVSEIIVTAENFNTNKDELYWGATTGWALSGADVANVASVSVSLYDALGNLLVTNTSKDPSKVNTAKQYSSAFIVKAGTYATSSTWNFGSWTPTGLVSPAKAVITVTDTNGYDYVAELLTFAAEEPSHPTWQSLFEVADIVVTPENFNTNKGDDYWGATTGWALSGADVGKVILVTVELYDAANNLLVTNVSKDPSKVNIAKQYSSAFIIKAGTYSTSSTWEFGVWTPNKGVMPAKAVITVMDLNGYEYVAELTAFLQEEPSHPTWVSLFPLNLFFSEYIEGSSNTKAIEIYNPSGTSIDLSAYTIELYTNGNTVVNTTITLSGTLAAGRVYVIANSGAIASILGVSDLTSTITYYNGDDCLVLKHNGIVIDSFGQVGFDPGTNWTVGGVATSEMTLVRKTSINGGDTNPFDVYDPSVEWIAYPQNTAIYIGWHEISSTESILIDTFTYADEAAFEAAWTNRVSASNALDPSELLQLDATLDTMVMTLPAVSNEGWWLARKYSTLASYGITDNYNYIWLYVTNNTNTTSLFSIWLYWTGGQMGYTVTLPAAGTSGWIYFQISNTGKMASGITDFGWGFNNFVASGQVTGNLVVSEVRVANHIPA